jgi:hypothetical protein
MEAPQEASRRQKSFSHAVQRRHRRDATDDDQLAALNDANIERLTRLLREMSTATKFLTITASTFAPGKLAVNGGASSVSPRNTFKV